MIIDADLHALISPLSADELNQLEQNIKKDGCRDPLVVWAGHDILLDGHNRYEICTRLGLPYKTVEIKFEDKDSAKIWLIKNQFGRRNLNNFQRVELASILKPLIAEKAREKQVQAGGAVPQKSAKPPIETREELATIAGVSHDTIHKGEVVLKRADEKTKEKLRLGDTSINAEYVKIKREQQEEERRTKINDIARQRELLPPEEKSNIKPSLVLADPPWQYEFSETESREIENQYPTMTVMDIINNPPATEDNCVLFLWATAPKLREAFEVIDGWGFSYKTNAIWNKEIIGSGYWFRGQHEILMVATKGSMSPPLPEHRVSSVFNERRTTHSKKPVCIYEWIEAAFPHLVKLEMFCRIPRSGWTTMGNEIL